MYIHGYFYSLKTDVEDYLEEDPVNSDLETEELGRLFLLSCSHSSKYSFYINLQISMCSQVQLQILEIIHPFPLSYLHLHT